MYNIRVKSFAKLNLYLDIISSGGELHELLMVMQSVSLADELTFEPINKNDIIIESNVKAIAENNIIEKAYKIYREAFKKQIDHGFKVKLEKRIPMGAGLAGGSSNAAAMVRVLIEFFNLKIRKKDLIELNLKIGSDVNFCYFGGTRLVEGRGETLSKTTNSSKYFLLVYPGISISTKEAFRIWDLNNKKHVPFLTKDQLQKTHSFYNAFEKTIYPMYPEIEKIKEMLLRNGAASSLLSGSGSTVFGVFLSKEECQRAANSFKDKGFQLFIVKKTNQGISILK